MSSLSSIVSSTGSAAASASSSAAAAGTSAQPASYKIIGIVLAILSGLFIGSSFVFKKKGLISAQLKAGGVAGEGHPYLKSPMWWTGMTLMAIGEIFNFVAYAFTEALLVTPLGALSVVVCAILSSIFLGEKLTFFGKIGCLLCILGATIVALNGPQEATTNNIPAFQKLFFSPGFLVYAGLVIIASLVLAFYVAPKHGKTNMLVYISICSLIGGLSVACTQGLGSSILTSIRGDNQFKHWFIYVLWAIVIITLSIEINYLNKALELFNTAMVTPTYYVMFTGFTLVTSTILYQGFKASAVDIVTVVMGFLVICSGITLLQLSKVDPTEIKGNIDRRSTMLLSASRSEIHRDGDTEKGLEIEDPGIDALRGSFGAIGSIHRAISSRRSMRREGAFDPSDVVRRRRQQQEGGEDSSSLGMGVVRHQLYDNPMPEDSDKDSSLATPLPRFADATSRDRSPSLTFAAQDTRHMYGAQGKKSGDVVVHEAVSSSGHMHGPRELATSPGGGPLTRSPQQSDIGSTFPESSPASPTFPFPPRESQPYVDPYERARGAPTEHGMQRDFRSNSIGSAHGASDAALSPRSQPKSRFPLPFRGTSKDRRHPIGTDADMERSESASLVHQRHVSEDSMGEGDEDDEIGAGLDRFDTRESERL
ncbi:hypothetical protein RQP46_001650 [Phenoliferia psychrophenolica]